MVSGKDEAAKLQRKLKFGQIGGGRDSFIGAVHRRAAISDGFTELVAGAMSSDPGKAKLSGEDLLLPPERNYGSWQEMLEAESKLPEGERIDFVSIVTPNHAHFEPAMAFVEAGFNVIMDKPMVHNSEQAQALMREQPRYRWLGALPTFPTPRCAFRGGRTRLDHRGPERVCGADAMQTRMVP